MDKLVPIAGSPVLQQPLIGKRQRTNPVRYTPPTKFTKFTTLDSPSGLKPTKSIPTIESISGVPVIPTISTTKPEEVAEEVADSIQNPSFTNEVAKPAEDLSPTDVNDVDDFSSTDEEPSSPNEVAKPVEDLSPTDVDDADGVDDLSSTDEEPPSPNEANRAVDLCTKSKESKECMVLSGTPTCVPERFVVLNQSSKDHVCKALCAMILEHNWTRMLVTDIGTKTTSAYLHTHTGISVDVISTSKRILLDKTSLIQRNARAYCGTLSSVFSASTTHDKYNSVLLEYPKSVSDSELVVDIHMLFRELLTPNAILFLAFPRTMETAYSALPNVLKTNFPKLCLLETCTYTTYRTLTKVMYTVVNHSEWDSLPLGLTGLVDVKYSRHTDQLFSYKAHKVDATPNNGALASSGNEDTVPSPTDSSSSTVPASIVPASPTTPILTSLEQLEKTMAPILSSQIHLAKARQTKQSTAQRIAHANTALEIAETRRKNSIVANQLASETEEKIQNHISRLNTTLFGTISSAVLSNQVQTVKTALKEALTKDLSMSYRYLAIYDILRTAWSNSLSNFSSWQDIAKVHEPTTYWDLQTRRAKRASHTSSKSKQPTQFQVGTPCVLTHEVHKMDKTDNRNRTKDVVDL